MFLFLDDSSPPGTIRFRLKCLPSILDSVYAQLNVPKCCPCRGKGQWTPILDVAITTIYAQHETPLHPRYSGFKRIEECHIIIGCHRQAICLIWVACLREI
jgi:hypothetical protein